MSGYKKSIGFFFCMVVVPVIAMAQNYPVVSIPEEIRKGSDAVVRYSETEFDYISRTHAKQRNVLVITVLGSAGEHMSVFAEHIDKFSSLSKFSGQIYDADGRPVRKIKSSELKYSDYSGSNLADDYRTYYCTPSTPPPPYSVRYEWETATKNAVWAFPAFYPVPAMSVGVEKSLYRLKLPAGTRFYVKAYNLEDKCENHSDGKKDIYEWKIEKHPPIFPEVFSKPRYELPPALFFSPEYFVYDGVEGSMRDWYAYAEWQWKLLENRSVLPPPLKTHIAELTRNAATDMEKLRILYDYLGESTRYVSIQIGIGGFQPMSVTEVYKTKYGDCKALTNYLHAMLKECGIESYYCEIGVDRRSIPPDFAHPAMSNHALLMVPVKTDTLWVECTNPELPLGYRHSLIVGQNALVYKDGSAEIIQVPPYPDTLNLSVRKADVNLAPDGYVTARVRATDHLHKYAESRHFGKMNANDRINFLRSEVNIPVAFISNTGYREVRESHPYSVLEYDLEATGIGSSTGSRMFFPAMLFRKPLSVKFSRTYRRSDIHVREGHSTKDITRVCFEGNHFVVEAVPADVCVESKYGSYSMSLRVVEDGIDIERSFFLRSGTYDKSEIDEFRNFIDSVISGDGGKIVLKKKQGSPLLLFKDIVTNFAPMKSSRKLLNEELGRLAPADAINADKIPVTVLLDNVRSMNNVGSFFRTCDAFGIEKLLLCGITGTPPNREIHKTALGAEDSVVWEHIADTVEAVEKLQRNGYTVITVEQVEGAVMLQEFVPQAESKYALVFGNEVDGVAQSVVDRCDEAIEIPQAGSKHSLNVSVSGGVVLWPFFCALRKLL